MVKVSLYLDSVFLVQFVYILSAANTFIYPETAISYSRYISKYTDI